MMYEIIYTFNGKQSWIYFSSTPAKYKEVGEKRFKAVVRDYGFKGAKLIKIIRIPKAVDPPLTKKQKEMIRNISKKSKAKRK